MYLLQVHEAPELVIAVLSPGSENERRDREVKLKLYTRRNASFFKICKPIFMRQAAQKCTGDDEMLL